MTVENFEAKKEQFLDITAIVEMEEIPPQLVFNGVMDYGTQGVQES